jgi:hypothetical protein
MKSKKEGVKRTNIYSNIEQKYFSKEKLKLKRVTKKEMEKYIIPVYPSLKGTY